MTQEQIIESYKKYCPKLKSAEMLFLKDMESIRQLEQFIKDGVVNAEDVIKAFKKANASRFCRGEVTGWVADIKWLTNPVNIDKVNSGKYDDKINKKKNRIQSHEYDWDEIERKLHQAHLNKLKEYEKKYEEDKQCLKDTKDKL